ncbi:MAG: hypothetical protein K8R54_00100 [Bacteroidales bacterium]|nr:hypothetical protein [Bacteroidales bacterium]
MKSKLLLIVLCFILTEQSSAQSYSVGLDYTSKFIGKTIDLNVMFQKNKHAFSGGLVFYTNQKAESEYGISKKQIFLSPVHFTTLRDEAFGETLIERFGLQLEYKYYLRENNDVQPYLFVGNVFSNIGFRTSYFPIDEYTVLPRMFVWDMFPGIGLQVKLWKNVFLNQSVSPGVLYINHSPFNSFSLNPMYRVGLIYSF